MAKTLVTINRKTRQPGRARAPDFRAGAQIAIESIIENVRTSTQFSGRPIKSNAPSTIHRKEHRRHKRRKPAQPLIDLQRRFLKKKFYRITLLKSAKGYVGFEIQHIAETHSGTGLVDEMHRRGYVGWFRPSRAAVERVRQHLTTAANKRTVTVTVTTKSE